jgi:hypothetical protein
MWIKSLAIAVVLAVFSTSIANAETYKTDKNHVVVTGLNAKQKYAIDVTNTKGKSRQRHLTTNTCGALLIDNAVKYKSLTVAGQTIDPSSLKTKVHERCKPKKNTKAQAKVMNANKVNPSILISPTPLPSSIPTSR